MKNRITRTHIISIFIIVLMVFPGSPAQLKWPLEYIIFAGWMLLGYLGYRMRRAKKDMSDEERAYQILGTYK